MPFSSPAHPAFGLLSCPLSPRPPSPVGKGEILGYFMQGASPLASPGAEPERRLLALPLWYPAGGVPPALPARRALAVPCGGLPSLSPAYPAFSLLSFPHPPSPLPLRGRGRLLLYFAGGFAPGTPALNRLRHLLALPRGRGPSQTPPSLATDSSISPGPPSPWLPALPPVNKQKPLVVQVPRPAQPWGCKGRSPLHKKTIILPFPAGKGVGGMGAG